MEKWQSPNRASGNKLAASIHDFEIRQLGCCGDFFFIVADRLSRKILKQPFFSFEDAELWINEQIVNKFSKEVLE